MGSKVYVDADNQRAEQNSEMRTTSILASISAVTRSKIHAIYDGLNIEGMVYGELVSNRVMKK